MTNEYPVLLGSYTSIIGKGIYASAVNGQTAKLEDLSLVFEGQKTSYFALTPDFVVSGVKESKDNDHGGLSSYQKNNTQALDTLINQTVAPAYVSYDQKRDLVFSANYHTSQISANKVDSSGKITEVASLTTEGSSIHLPNQRKSHPHYIDLTPEDQIIVCDLGMDEVRLYDLSNDEFVLRGTFKTPAGFGPRHLKFIDNHTFFVVGELSNQVIGVSVANNEFKSLSLTDLPSSDEPEVVPAPAAIKSLGKYIYISIRESNKLAVYDISDPENPIHIQTIDVFGDRPRDFDITSDGKYLLCANQISNNATLYEINAQTGHLTMVEYDMSVPECSCVKFF